MLTIIMGRTVVDMMRARMNMEMARVEMETVRVRVERTRVERMRVERARVERARVEMETARVERTRMDMETARVERTRVDMEAAMMDMETERTMAEARVTAKAKMTDPDWSRRLSPPTSRIVPYTRLRDCTFSVTYLYCMPRENNYIASTEGCLFFMNSRTVSGANQLGYIYR